MGPYHLLMFCRAIANIITSSLRSYRQHYFRWGPWMGVAEIFVDDLMIHEPGENLELFVFQ